MKNDFLPLFCGNQHLERISTSFDHVHQHILIAGDTLQEILHMILYDYK